MVVTLKDVAEKAGVSTSTVSRVLSGKGRVGKKCQAHVKKIVEEMGYRPNTNARALACNRTEMIGLITPNIAGAFHGPICVGVEEAASKIRYKILIANSFDEYERVQEAIYSFSEQGCDNIIIHTNFVEDDELIQLAERIPGLVIINRFIPEIAERCVWLDNVSGGRLAAKYLIDSGHKDIAVISHSRKIADPKDRLTGVLEACEKAGISIPEQNILFDPIGTIDEGRLLARQLVESDAKFTAIIAYNDLMAVGAINELQDMGIRVPEDVSVIGFDDLYFCQTSRPTLTTIHYPISEMAKYAAELSVALTTKGKDATPKTHLFMPSLVERKSVKTL
ncbi:DNA-binding transcriptional regulator GalS [Saccharobesus litoralis]|uniref:DNA-binding transcriptional regulator GalS n=1 Tax=Saccharobesus litoralis TaxID=2172099 RepID=A0A2S0VLY0_9ALTE|nr:LacI family DNA-binding transcriptional regulator [Saccharobesus litoralis]AWB65224.1 DNA-binding transcriptional regulator GalS [Saccharobesus litoralis]